MNEKKSKGNKGLIITLVIFFLIIIGLIGFICYDKGIILNSKSTKIISNNEDTKKDSKTKTTDTTQTDSNIIIDTNKCINCSGKDGYYLISSKDHIPEVKAYFYSNDNTKGFMSIDIDSYNQKAVTNYSLTTPYFEYNFNKQIQDVIISNIGQEELAPIVIYLMQDGTINYIDIYSGLENNNLQNYKTIADVQDITKLYTVSNCSSERCSSSTILAQKSDGTLYDIAPFIYPTAN